MAKKGKGEIEELNDSLYSRTSYQDPLDKRPPVRKRDTPNVVESWETPELDEMLRHERVVQKAHPLMKKIFILALIFFIGTVIVAGFIFSGGINFISSRNVDISIVGPSSVSAGELFELGVVISNSNNADLELTNLSVQYPEGSRSPDSSTESLTYTKDDIGLIKAGSEVVLNKRLSLLGPSGEPKELKFSVEYKVKGSNAVFYKDKIFNIIIGDTPIVLNIESPSSVTSGESFETLVSVTLKSSDILKNVVLKAEYPYGYSASETTPKPANDDNVWVLGDLSPEDKKTISIRGQLIGEDQEERTFRFYVGVAGDSNSSNLKIAMVSTLNTIAIDRPFIDLDVLFNGEDSSHFIAPVAKPISTSIRFKNNLTDKLLNPRLEVKISGPALDKNSVTTGSKGFYDPQTSTATWNLTNALGNPELVPGEGGQVTLRLASLDAQLLPEDSRNIILDLLITGVPIGGVGQRPVVVRERHTIKVSSQVNFSSKALHSLGSFANHGPIPPKVDKETTYTGVFTISNMQNDIVEAKVTAKLGANVTWLGASSFASEDISYDLPTNTITWDLGNLSSASNTNSVSREVSFQVALTPLLGQIGITPDLVTNILFSGRDTLTGNNITISNPSLTTKLIEDPNFIQGDGIVVK